MTTTSRTPTSRSERWRRAAAVAAAGVTASLALAVITPTAALAAPPGEGRTYYVSPDGRDQGSCQQQNPCSIEGAKAVVSREAPKSRGDITVELADGVYRIAKPLQFGQADGGHDGSTVRWVAAPGAHPEISGATPVSGWSVHDAAAGIYVADTPVGLDTRQLYVDGKLAPRAALPLKQSDITLTPTGLTINDPALAQRLTALPDQKRIEFQSLGDFTTRYSPVAGIGGNFVTMAQPAWDNNTWGYDTVQQSFLAAPTWSLENSLAFVDEAGEWYLDPAAGKLYYKPASGTNPADLDVELPRVETLVSVSGSYEKPVSNLAFEGLRFSGTTWLGPSRDGYANQQNGTFLQGAYDYRPADAFTSCARGCEAFERARNTWAQEPAAVQVSAAHNVSFTRNTFTALGQSALGIGNDTNATLSGVGLGAQGIKAVGNVFTEVGGHGVVVGGVRPDAHHPSDPRMTNSDVLVQDNTINRVALVYKDNSGILSTYVTGARILHNEVANVSYDGIDTGFGWGANDAGGSGEYEKRGYYKWNPRYTTPTTLRDNVVSGNLVHDTKAAFADGGNLYNLSASPGSVVERNYLFKVSGVALYLDEGSRYTTWQENVLEGTSPWVFTNSYSEGNNTSDNVIRHNWYTKEGAQVPSAEERRNQLIDNVLVDPANWPADALGVICAAGVAPDLRTELNANLHGINPACAGVPDPGR
ncbi:right-handed parallel beta-helix repeat-containing protein [Pseudonocardia xinjiangensis]|uniref:right-handed parallel beta-helix repeat-containing protein n=1 Tax=Pseudonocardia xinjiangensis TaxID=75289 RepID=UPI003D947433